MSRVKENEELREVVDLQCKDEDLISAILENPSFADSVALGSIGTYLMDISKSLAVIADAMAGEEET